MYMSCVMKYMSIFFVQHISLFPDNSNACIMYFPNNSFTNIKFNHNNVFVLIGKQNMFLIILHVVLKKK